MKGAKHILLLAVLIPILAAQTPRTTTVLDIRQMMSAADFNRAGLNKLTPDEITNLNQWLYTYSVRMLSNTAEPTEHTGAVIESYIDGDFEGWDGDTIFKLDNGQIWQQDSYAYTYRYSYHPKVLIYKDGIRYKMKVEGVSDSIVVKRIK